MVLESIIISNPFFHTEIITKNQKWKRMAIGYPSLIYNKVSNNSKGFTNKINFFLSLQFQKHNVKLLNMLWNHLNLALIQLKSSLYQSKTEIMTRNFQNTFVLSFLENKNIKIDKKSNTSNINNVIEFLKSKSEVHDTAHIFREISSLKLLNSESRYLSYVLELRTSRFESGIKKRIERTGNIIKNLTLPDALSISQNLSDPKVTVHLENWGLLKEENLLKNIILLNREGFIGNIDSLRGLKPSAGIKSLKKSYFLNNQSYFLNCISSLNSRIFLNKIKYLSILSSSNSVHQSLSMVFSKASSLIYLHKFTERQIRIAFPAKNVTGLKFIQNEHYFAQQFKMLKANKIKNPVLMFTLELPESLSNRIFSELPKSIKLIKKPGFLKDNILLSKKGLLKNITTLKIFSSSTIKSNFHNIYFSDYNINLSNIVFSTGVNHLGNLSFSKVVQYLFDVYLTKASSHKHTQNFMERPLRIDFPARKAVELKVTDNEPYFAEKFNMLKVLGLENVHPAFEHIPAFPPRLFNLSLEILTFHQRITKASVLVNQMPEIINKKPVLSLHEFKIRSKTAVQISKRKELLPFVSGNEIRGFERGKNLNFQKNGVNLIFRTQSETEQKVDEKIEQKIGQKIEQLKKAAVETKEAIIEQGRSDYSGIRTNQKQYLDVNSISDQVFRLMERRLKIERERRGIL